MTGAPEGSGSRRFPMLTATVLAVAVIAAILQYAAPATVPALQRTPGAFGNGQWWRLLTPLLVQTLGWYQVLTNLVTLALFGTVCEWLLGRWRWVLLFVAGAVGGQIAAYAWDEGGGGDSIAICGLAGGVAVALLAGRTPGAHFAVQPVVYYVVALTGWGFSGIRAAAAGCVAAAILLHGLNRLGVPQLERFALVGTVLCALALAATRDLHGVALTSGMALMAILLVIDEPPA